MFKFHFLRSSKDILGNLILICIPTTLIIIFNMIYDNSQMTSFLTIGFALTFQIYGAALSFESLGNDFLTPMYDRIMATPVNPRSIVISVLTSSIVVSFLQSLVVILFSKIFLNADFTPIVPIILIILLMVIINQLLGVVILFLSKKVKSANAVTVFYGSVAPILAGIYFPLPKGAIFDIFQKYLTPLSLAQNTIYGIINKEYNEVVIGVSALLVIATILFLLIKPLSKKVIA